MKYVFPELFSELYAIERQWRDGMAFRCAWEKHVSALRFAAPATDTGRRPPPDSLGWLRYAHSISSLLRRRVAS